jgi:hypothetical protein
MEKKHKTLPLYKNSPKYRDQRSRFMPRTGTNDPRPSHCTRAHVETYRSRFVLEPGPALVPSYWSRFGNRDQWPARTGTIGVFPTSVTLLAWWESSTTSGVTCVTTCKIHSVKCSEVVQESLCVVQSQYRVMLLTQWSVKFCQTSQWLMMCLVCAPASPTKILVWSNQGHGQYIRKVLLPRLSTLALYPRVAADFMYFFTH